MTSDHCLTMCDLNLKDKHNYAAAERMCSPRVIESITDPEAEGIPSFIFA